MLELTLVASALLYGKGVAALWRKAGTGRGLRTAEAARFAIGWAVLVAALVSPLHGLAERSFAMHMIQHELLMVVAAPLLVLSRPLEAWAWALTPRLQRAFGALARMPALRLPATLITGPAGAWVFHAIALWLWHVPVLFGAALRSEGLHILQHACFFGSALAFWWSVFGRGARIPGAMSVASLFTTMLHTGALAALLTFAPVALYTEELPGKPLGLGALEDQQLGGLVMWVPGSLAYLVASLAIAASWLRGSPVTLGRPSHDPRQSD